MYITVNVCYNYQMRLDMQLGFFYLFIIIIFLNQQETESPKELESIRVIHVNRMPRDIFSKISGLQNNRRDGFNNELKLLQLLTSFEVFPNGHLLLIGACLQCHIVAMLLLPTYKITFLKPLSRAFTKSKLNYLMYIYEFFNVLKNLKCSGEKCQMD